MIKFKNIPIHVCEQAPKDKPFLTTISKICPFCGEDMTKYDTEEHGNQGRKRNGSPTFYKLLEEMAITHDKKSHDYASNENPYGNYHFAGKLASLFAHSHEDAGFVSRLGEKLYRLANLESSQKIAQNETIDDTEKDICVIVALWISDRRDRRTTRLANIKKIKDQINNGEWSGNAYDFGNIDEKAQTEIIEIAKNLNSKGLKDMIDYLTVLRETRIKSLNIAESPTQKKQE